MEVGMGGVGASGRLLSACAGTARQGSSRTGFVSTVTVSPPPALKALWSVSQTPSRGLRVLCPPSEAVGLIVTPLDVAKAQRIATS